MKTYVNSQNNEEKVLSPTLHSVATLDFKETGRKGSWLRECPHLANGVRSLFFAQALRVGLSQRVLRPLPDRWSIPRLLLPPSPCRETAGPHSCARPMAAGAPWACVRACLSVCPAKDGLPYVKEGTAHLNSVK